MDAEHLSVLRRVGRAQIVVGLLDIGLMVYCVVRGLPYQSSFNIFAVVAGVFLVRGNLRAAGIVLWFAAFMLAGLGCLVVGWPLIVPPGLMLAELRLYTVSFASSLIFGAAAVGFLYWVTQQLRPLPVLPARMWGFTAGSLRSAITAGMALFVILAVATGFMLNGQSAKRAVEVATSQLGSGYAYHVSSIHWMSRGHGTEVSAVVTAWNAREIRNVPVHWHER